MNPFPLDSSFTKKFRQEISLQFGTDGIPYHNLVFKTIGISKTEIPSISELLVPMLHDENLIHHLLVKITNNDIPDIESLYKFTKETSDELLTYANDEVNTSAYYSHIIKTLHSFLELVQEFETNGIQSLCTKLTEYFTDEINPPATSEEASNLFCIIEDYKYRIDEYFQHFHFLLQKESETNENNARVIVMSQVAYYLDTIFATTEKLINNTESTLALICSWETAILIRDEQELYN
jgi:hypothetical protein